MKKIQLTQGQFALVDDEDYKLVSRYTWCAYYNWGTLSFYAATNVRLESGKWYSLQMARFILGLEKGDKRQADHIHHDTLDNRRSQIRIVTKRQNNHNRQNPYSIYPGVSWGSNRCKWYVRIYHNDKRIYLGSYEDELDAAKAYKDYANEHGIAS